MRPLSAAWLGCTLALAASASLAAPPKGAYQAQARDLFAKVIGYKTSVEHAQVPALAAFLAGKFRAAGFPEADVHVLPVGDTAALVVRYRGDGTGGKPVLLLSHMDVVSAKPEDWKRDPFTLVEENGYFYGRGTYDVKNGVTILTSTFLRLKQEGYVPKRDLIIAFTGDEETAMATTRALATTHHDLVDAEFALNADAGGGTLDEDGKPVVYGLQTAEKTYASFEMTTHNPGGHSSLPRADNAIYDLADALKKVQAYQFPVMWNDTTVASFRASGTTTAGELGAAMRRFAEHPGDAAAAAELAKSPGDVGRTRTTCVATELRGGHAENALPQSATATVNCRIFPGVAVDVVGRTLQDVVGPDVAVTGIGDPTATDASPLRPDVLAAVERAVHKLHPGVTIVPVQESGATDGVHFRAAGIPTYGVSGLFIKHSDEFAHGLDERVPVQGFYDDLQHWYMLVKDVGG